MRYVKKYFVFVALFIVIAEQCIQPVQVFAISDELRQFYTTNDITTFDPNDCTLAGYENNGAVSLKGDTIIEKILSFFMSQPGGLTLAQAAGIVGNMARESGDAVDAKTGVKTPNPAKEQGGKVVGPDYQPKNGVGFGLVQWTFTGRQQGLVDLVTTGPMQGKKITDLDVQLTYVWQELNSPTYQNTLQALKNAKYAAESAIIVHGPPYPGYEASADSPQAVSANRGGDAEKVYQAYKDAPSLESPDAPQKKSDAATTMVSNPSTTDSHKTAKTCDMSFAGGDFNATLLAYAWPTYKGKDINATEAYKTAVQKALSEGRYVGGQTYKGIDCGGFVSLLMVDSGYESGYNDNDRGGATGEQERWLKEHWAPISATDAGDRQPGDVAINGTHTYVYVGNVPGFSKPIASASLDERAPMAGTEGVTSTEFHWYRKSGSGTKSDLTKKV